MRGSISPLPQYAFMAWCSVKEQAQLYLYLTDFQTYGNVSIFIMAVYTGQMSSLCASEMGLRMNMCLTSLVEREFRLGWEGELLLGMRYSSYCFLLEQVFNLFCFF